MKDKPERYRQLEERVWANLNQSGLLPKIVAKSGHAGDTLEYAGVEFWNEFQLNKSTHQYMMWIQIMIQHKKHRQPVTPKIYRFTKGADEQRGICEQIWEGVTEGDIQYMAHVAAEEYSAGRRWMDNSQRVSMDKFFPAIQRKDVVVELIPDLAQYKVYIKNK